jgi:hypothetical protein
MKRVLLSGVALAALAATAIPVRAQAPGGTEAPIQAPAERQSSPQPAAERPARPPQNAPTTQEQTAPQRQENAAAPRARENAAAPEHRENAAAPEHRENAAGRQGQENTARQTAPAKREMSHQHAYQMRHGWAPRYGHRTYGYRAYTPYRAYRSYGWYAQPRAYGWRPAHYGWHRHYWCPPYG